MATVLRIVGYLSIPVLLLSVGLTIRSIRREQTVAVTVRSSLIPMALVAVMVFVYVALLGVPTSNATTALPLVAGAVAGWWWNTKTTRLTLHRGRVQGSKTYWVLVPWALTVSLTQGLALAESPLTVPIGFTALFASSGLAFGENLALLRRRTRLLGGRPPVAPAATSFLVFFLVVGLPGVAEAADFSFESIATDEVPSVSVEITGSGQGYYGDSISALVRNDTGGAITIEVETGLQLVPRDSTAQTMLTLGQTVRVPPGGATVLIKAFCGEMHDRAPGDGDTFDVGGKIEDPDLMRALEEMRRQNAGDSYDAQQLVWHFRDGNDISTNEAAQDLLDSSRRVPIREDAEKSAGATAVLAGAVGIGLTRTDDRRLLTGAAALEHLQVRGASIRTIRLVDPVTGLMTHKVFTLPPADIPADDLAVAFTTRDVVDADTGETVTVIDDLEEVQVLRRPIVSPTAEPVGSEPTPAADDASPRVAPRARPVKKIDDGEVKRIVDWGVTNNRRPEDIQRDIDARNESLGGSGVVPVGELPVRIELPQGEVTLTQAEYAEYRRRAERMSDLLDNARVHRHALEELEARARKWSAWDKAVVVRWLAGTKQIYDQATLMNDPGPWMARRSGFGTVDEMLEVGYGRPTWTTYDTRKHDSLDDAIAAWKREPGGAWARYQREVAEVKQQARERLETMLSPVKPSGDAATIPERIFVGPTVNEPTALYPGSSPSRMNTSWYNRPAHELKQILEHQRQSQEYLRGVRVEMDKFLKYEADLARRIPTPPAD